MLLFGKEKVYVSHLPMFHSPHDYQLIAELELPEHALLTYLKAKENHPEETVFTLVPESFVLPEMVAHPRAFQASLVRGHFERGGTEIVGNVTVKIGKVLHFRKFAPDAIRPAQATYLLFGNSKESFLAHFISKRPDFDQVVELSDGLPPALQGEAVQVAANAGNLSPLPMGEIQFDSLSLNLARELYLEFGDLR